MKPLRLTPSVTPESNRHKRPWKDSSRTIKVPILDGEKTIEGKFRIPLSLIASQPHTNERLECNKFIKERMDRWISWRQQRGWSLESVPQFRFTRPLSADSKRTGRYFDRVRKVLGREGSVEEVRTFDDAEEMAWCMVKAKFRQTIPIYANLNDVLFLRDLGAIYEHDVEPQDTGWVSPMQYAEARRQRLGLKRSDYLMGKHISEPL